LPALINGANSNEQDGVARHYGTVQRCELEPEAADATSRIDIGAAT
jgi:hypothetical protein